MSHDRTDEQTRDVSADRGDHLAIAVAGNGQLRALAAVTTALVQEGASRHGTAPTATAALGRTLTAAALLGATVQDRQTVTIRIAGDGPLGGLMAESTGEGDVRGYVTRPDVDLPLNAAGKFDVAGAVGRSGFVHVTRDLGLREPYAGSAPIVSGELGEDISYYLTTSEQVPSAVGLGVLVGQSGDVLVAGGFLLQTLPGAADDVLAQAERNIGQLGSVTSVLQETPSGDALLNRLLAGLEWRLLATRPLRFACRCSRDKAQSALASLHPDELAEMAAADGGAELRCHFCNELYWFSAGELGVPAEPPR